jgi:hypothetical protein
MGATRGARSWTRRGSVLAAVGGVTGLTAAAGIPAGLARTDEAPGTGGIHLIGDSWAAGLHADPANALGQVAARALGRPITVDAVSGTGYLNDAGRRTYLQRAAGASGTERLVVVQGGSNDDDQDIRGLAAAVTATVRTLQRRFPDASVLLLGPGPDPAPVTAVQWAVDRTIASAAAEAGVEWVSMLHERWIPEDRLDAVIDPDNHHPTVSGQEYLGLRLAAALRLREPSLLSSTDRRPIRPNTATPSSVER